jgi:bifunctional DNA-binding transcriptional regulator/antitoxin component of YhaV-PrlF toxin-antitoxin module
MKVSRTGQILIPLPMQAETGIYPGADVELRHENGAIVVRRSEPDEHVRGFRAKLEELEELRARRGKGDRISAKILEEVAGLSRGEQFVQLLANAGIGHMTTDEFMEMMRGPYEDLDPR